jgi:murein L,D-transpeptidase YafK
MKRTLLILFVLATASLLFVVSSQEGQGSFIVKSAFRTEQKKNARVKTAYDLQWPSIKKKLNDLGVDTSDFEIFIRGFKEEKELELWVKSEKNASFLLYTTYRICASSGELGPKRCQGDGQVPEGFYQVSVFNPYSNYHLSLGVSYPNSSDKIFACKRDAGGAIMIHGNCVTIGCIPITDDKIRELYVMAVEAKSDGQASIPIHLFPARLTKEKLEDLKKTFFDKSLHPFWDNLKTGYDDFEKTKLVKTPTVDSKGMYVF